MVRVQKLTLFLPHDAIRYIAQSLLSSGVRLSIAFLHCIQTAEDIFKHLSRLGNPMILVFLTPSTDTQFQGNFAPIRLGRKIHGGGKNFRFSTEIAVYFGKDTHKIGP